jgi:hypothetical protein
MARLHLEEAIPRFAPPQGHTGPSWAHEFDSQIRHGLPPGPGASGGSWAAEFSGLPPGGPGAVASTWAEQFAEVRGRNMPSLQGLERGLFGCPGSHSVCGIGHRNAGGIIFKWHACGHGATWTFIAVLQG